MVNFSFNIATCHEARQSKKFEITSLKMNFLKCFWMIWYSNFITKIILFLLLIDLRIGFTHPTIYSHKIIFDDMQRHLWTKKGNYVRSKIIYYDFTTVFTRKGHNLENFLYLTYLTWVLLTQFCVR